MDQATKDLNDRFYERYMALELELGNLLAAGRISQRDFLKRRERLNEIKAQMNELGQELRQMSRVEKNDLPERFYLNSNSQKLCRLFYQNLNSTLKELCKQGNTIKKIVFKTLNGHAFYFSHALRLSALKKMLLCIENKERLLKLARASWQQGPFLVIQKLAKIEGQAGPLDLNKLKELFYQWEMKDQELCDLRKEAQNLEQDIQYKKQYLFQTERKIGAYNPYMTKWF